VQGDDDKSLESKEDESESVELIRDPETLQLRFQTPRHLRSFSSSHWIPQVQTPAEFNERQLLKSRNHDGFLDFKIFIRLTILELKLTIYPIVPLLSVLSKSGSMSVSPPKSNAGQRQPEPHSMNSSALSDSIFPKQYR